MRINQLNYLVDLNIIKKDKEIIMGLFDFLKKNSDDDEIISVDLNSYEEEPSNWFENILDNASNAVKNFTGENERREIVE